MQTHSTFHTGENPFATLSARLFADSGNAAISYCVVNILVSIQIFVQGTIFFYLCFDSENVAGSNYMMLVSNPNSLSKLYFFIFLFFYFSFNLSLLSGKAHLCR